MALLYTKQTFYHQLVYTHSPTGFFGFLFSVNLRVKVERLGAIAWQYTKMFLVIFKPWALTTLPSTLIPAERDKISGNAKGPSQGVG